MEDAAAGHEAIYAYERQELTGAQLSLRLQRIFNKDCSKEQAFKILNACSLYQVTGHDTPSDVMRFLKDFEALRGKVPTLALPPPLTDMHEFFDQTTDYGRLSVCIMSLLDSTETAGLRQINLQKIWHLLQEFAVGGKRLLYTSTKNTSANQWPWRFFLESDRPNNIILGKGKVYLFGEETEMDEDFPLAVSELTSKIAELPAAMYGKLKFVICYAAAGASIQFFMLRLRVQDRAPVLDPVTEMLSVITDAPQLVLIYVKLYFLLLGMDAAVPDVSRQYQHGTFHSRGSHCRIKLNRDGAVKELLDFDSYAEDYGVRFEDLWTAYKAAGSADGHVITSVFGPKLEISGVDARTPKVEEADLPSTSSESSAPKRRKISKVYEVQTLPLCAKKLPECEQEVKEMAYGVLRGLKALHDAGLVHRDIRFSNIMFDYVNEKYVLIDLESVARDGEVPVCQLRDWDGGTLEEGEQYTMRYTKLSDFHQLGLVLRLNKVVARSKAFEEFVDLLLSKASGTTADSLLQHPWIVQLSG